MSICCNETGVTISSSFGGEGVEFCITREDSESFSAICPSVLNNIPQPNKMPTPGKNKNGLDIHRGSGTSFGAGNFKLGKFLYSVDDATAKKYFPNSYKKTYPPKNK